MVKVRGDSGPVINTILTEAITTSRLHLLLQLHEYGFPDEGGLSGAQLYIVSTDHDRIYIHF